MQISKELLLKILVPLVLLMLGGLWLIKSDQPAEKVVEESSFWQETTQTTVNVSQQKCYADVKGAVVKPGMYVFDEGDRLIDLIEKAGGFHEQADQKQINLAKRIEDQEVIYIPAQGEEIPLQTAGGTTQGETVTETETEKININTADEKQLQELSGIGEKKAQEIINYREQHGSFKTVEDLTQVSGIGEKTLEKLRESITI